MQEMYSSEIQIGIIKFKNRIKYRIVNKLYFMYVFEKYQNIYNPTNLAQCEGCKKVITNVCKILIKSIQKYYCPLCFTNLTLEQSSIPQSYYVINTMKYPLFDKQWTAYEELMMFNGLIKYGFGNWHNIAEYIKTNKNKNDVEEHYISVFASNDQLIYDDKYVINKRDPQTNRLLIIDIQPATVNLKNQALFSTTKQYRRPYRRRGRKAIKLYKNGDEIIGYMPKRQDCQVEYNNDAQIIIGQLEFNEKDTQESIQQKVKLLQLYNTKLTKRQTIKQFVLSRNLLDLKEQIRIEKQRSKQQDRIPKIMKPLSQFHTIQEHEKLISSIQNRKQIIQKIEQLKSFKKKGFNNLAQIQHGLQRKRKFFQKYKQNALIVDLPSTQPAIQLNKVLKQSLTLFFRPCDLTYDEKQLYNKINLSAQQYKKIKQKMINQSLRQGFLEQNRTVQMLKIDKSIIQAIFNFLVQKQMIISV